MASMVYQQTRNVGLDDDQVQAAGKVIDAIRKRNGGVCPPAEYVEMARPENSPIHDTLDWDAGAALERQLMAQAREIVRVVVRIVGDAETAPAYVNASVTTLVREEIVRGTVSPEMVLARPDWLTQAERRLWDQIKGDCQSHGYLPLARRVLEFLEGLEREQGAAPAA
jgi:hypothetical protein